MKNDISNQSSIAKTHECVDLRPHFDRILETFHYSKLNLNHLAVKESNYVWPTNNVYAIIDNENSLLKTILHFFNKFTKKDMKIGHENRGTSLVVIFLHNE